MQPEAWWTLHYRLDGVVHIADLASQGSAWCILRCDPQYHYETAAGDVVLPVTCLACLAEEQRLCD